MPFICKRRTDIPSGVLQVLDLQPNTSQRNLIYEPLGQTKYIERPVNSTVAVASNVTSGVYTGVAAYLIDAVAKGTDGTALTATQANAMMAGIMAGLNAGAAATLANVNALLAAVVAGTTLTAGGSVGVLTELLKILAGGEYVLPAGSAANAAAPFKGSQVGAFTAGQYLQTRQTGALEISLGDGHLEAFTSSTYEYAGVTGAALIVYDDTGAIKTAVV